MEKEIIGIYKLVVYSDGSIDLKNLESDPYSYESEGVSERTKQIISVIKLVRQMCMEYPECNPLIVDKFVTFAIKKVAMMYGVATQTVQDKCTRQIGLTKSEFSFRLHALIYDKNSEDFSQSSPTLYNAIVTKTNNKADIFYLQKTLVDCPD